VVLAPDSLAHEMQLFFEKALRAYGT
jgi:hypothetical protein